MKLVFASGDQCDRIGRFIALWATFLSLWQQLFCPNCHIFMQFVKGVEIFHFSTEISFGPLGRLFTGHAAEVTYPGNVEFIRQFSVRLLGFSRRDEPIAVVVQLVEDFRQLVLAHVGFLLLDRRHRMLQREYSKMTLPVLGNSANYQSGTDKETWTKQTDFNYPFLQGTMSLNG